MHVILIVLGFLWWWPVGLLLLGFMIARRKSGWRRLHYAGDGHMFDREHGCGRWERKMTRMRDKMEIMRSRMDSVRSGRDWFGPSTSGNRAFDDYRAETLKRLEEEQREFKDFLDHLRVAKDRAEFDQFMANRRQRPSEPDSRAEPPAEPHN
jgi:hypothetical protein